MYDKHVKLFRYCAEADCTECAVAGCPGPQKFLKEAANIIEELSKYADTVMRLKNEGWYLQQAKNYDGYAAIATMPIPEPQKESKT